MKQTERKNIDELVSKAEKYASLYMLLYVDSADAESDVRYACRSCLNDIFVQLESRCEQEVDVEQRARILCGLFHIIRETIAVIDSEKEHRCYQLCHRMMTDALASSLTGIPVLKCIADYLYTCADEEDGRFHKFFFRQLDSWAAEQDANGCWEGLSSEETAARLELMDMRSYMLMDDSCASV